ncbi:hypothetical protein V1511DRAFT_504802 [Dipodascopsis uninucleata]
MTVPNDGILNMDNVTLADHIRSTLRVMNISDPDEYMRSCLSRSASCGSCLGGSKTYPCGWCPSSQACVPNPNHLGILAAIRDRHICPFPSERYEFRARELGCHVSSITLWTAVIAFVIGITIILSAGILTMFLARRKVLTVVERLLRGEKDEIEHGFQTQVIAHDNEVNNRVDASNEKSPLLNSDNTHRTDELDAEPMNAVDIINALELYGSRAHSSYGTLSSSIDDDHFDERSNMEYVYDPAMLPVTDRPHLHDSPVNRDAFYQRYRQQKLNKMASSDHSNFFKRVADSLVYH